MKVTDCIADFLVSKNITKCFSVTGGFAMHLNDSFGERLNVTYTHGENPAGYSAVGWSSVDHNPSICCVTSGCGATNAITPCLIAYQDSVPVFFISGQVQMADNIRSRGGKIRGYFGSDCDIIECVKNITKFSYELTDPCETYTILNKCYEHLTTGRLGPVWLSIPIDIQSKQVPSESFIEYVKPSIMFEPLPNKLNELCSNSERPIILAGNGIHISKTVDKFKKFIKIHKVPYVVSFFGSDLGNDYIGKVGLIGTRSGNFAIQNADLILCLGCRLSKSITGYNRELFARESTVVYVDLDDTEHDIEDKKVDMKIKCDLQTFFNINTLSFSNLSSNWIYKNNEWKTKWSIEFPHITHDLVCAYRHLHNFYKFKPNNGTVILSSGSIYCIGWHTYIYKEGDRFITSGHGDMGYEVPVAIGVSLFDTSRRVYSIVGDGSFQYNINELQTIKDLDLDITIMIFNNGGYGAIKITQENVFKRQYGTSLNICDIKKLCKAYEIPYICVTNSEDISYLEHTKGPLIVEIVCAVQERYPKISNKPLSDGTFKNMPHEEMFPFLDDNELEENLFINRLK